MKKVELLLPSKSPLDAGRGRALKVAGGIDRTLRRFDALPAKDSDRSLIGDLAVLESEALALARAIGALAAAPSSTAGRRTFEDRLVDVAAHLDGVRRTIQDARGPLRRMVRRRCGAEGEAMALMRSIELGLDAVTLDDKQRR